MKTNKDKRYNANRRQATIIYILNMTNKSKYAGMTANERLYVSGLIDQYYEAIEKKNIDTVISILKTIELSDEDINANLRLNNLRQS